MNTLTRAYSISIGLIAIITIASHFILSFAIETNQYDGKLINDSIKLRSLTQSAALYANQLTIVPPDRAQSIRQKLKTLITEMETIQDDLIHGRTQESIPPSTSEKLQSIIYDEPYRLHYYMSNYLRLLRNIEQSTEEQLQSGQFQNEIIQIDDLDLQNIVPTLELITREFEQVFLQRKQSLLTIQTILTGINILVLIIIVLFIFRPMVHKIEDYTHQLQYNSKRSEMFRFIAFSANSSETIHDFLQSSLQRICNFIHWQTGHVVYWNDVEKNVFDSISWYETSALKNAHQFNNQELESVYNTLFNAIQNYIEFWETTDSLPPDSLSLAFLQQSNINTLCAIPISINQTIIGMIVLCSEKTIKKDPSILYILETASSQFSRAIEREKAKLLQEEYIQEIVQAKKTAEESNRMKSDFLANMSHEIRTPIHRIQSAIDIVMETKLDEEQNQFLHMAVEANKNLTQMIRRIFYFSELESGNVNPKENLFTLTQLVQKTLESVNDFAKEKDNQIIPALPNSADEPLLGDIQYIHQVLFNILHNAVKFTDHGTVQFKVSIEEETDMECKVRFTVSDTGIGIPDEKMTTIFHDFTQADSSFSRLHEGMGIGLTICRKIVNHFNGQIGVEKNEDIGTTFWVLLPLKKLN